MKNPYRRNDLFIYFLFNLYLTRQNHLRTFLEKKRKLQTELEGHKVKV